MKQKFTALALSLTLLGQATWASEILSSNQSVMVRQNQAPQSLKTALTNSYGGGKSNVGVSILFPGVGLYRATGSPITLTFLPVCYGLIGYGSIKVMKGKSDFNKYLEEKNPTQQDLLFDSANQNSSSGHTMLGIGASLWIIQACWTYAYGSSNDMYRKRGNNWNDKITLGPGYFDFQSKTVSLSTVIKL